MSLTLARFLWSALVAAATAVVLVAVALSLFLNPVWVGFEQVRTGADRFTGFSIDEVHRVTNAVLGELVLGPATFLQTVGSVEVFDPRERGHLADVHGVLIGFFVVAAVALAVLVVSLVARRGRAWIWRAVAVGSGLLAIAVVAVGSVAALFFDATFDVFHRIFFASGSYTFDPANERLVQLFPEQFWSETAIALAVVILGLSLIVLFGSLRAREVRASASARGGLATEART